MTLPNILTLLRMAVLPFMVLLFFIPTHWAAWSCLALYGLGCATDYLDGWIARKYNQISEFGTFMDPISDKVFVTTIMLMLIATDTITGVWVLLILIILIRELLISGLREFLGPRNIKLPVTDLAKWKTAAQMIALGCLIIADISFPAMVIGKVLLLAATAITAYTGWLYMQTGFKHFNL